MGSIIAILVIILIVIVFFQMNKYSGSSMNAAEAADLIKNSKVVILDVRTKGEYLSGHIKGARHIPVSELNQQLASLELVKEQQFLVYCHSGNRSLAASTLLQKKGFSRVINLRNGIIGWTAGGYKLEQ